MSVGKEESAGDLKINFHEEKFFPVSTDGYWLVNFPQYGEKDDIAEIDIKEDLKVVPRMDAKVNEQIKAQFENAEKTCNNNNGIFKECEDISDYMV